MDVVALPDREFVAVNTTSWTPESLGVVVQWKVPLDPPIGTNDASLGTGRSLTSAWSCWIGSPSGSVALTENSTTMPSATTTESGASTQGPHAPPVPDVWNPIERTSLQFPAVVRARARSTWLPSQSGGVDHWNSSTYPSQAPSAGAASIQGPASTRSSTRAI